MAAKNQARHVTATFSHWALVCMLVVELGLFSALGTNFLTLGNGLEILRLSVEIGLLTLGA